MRKPVFIERKKRYDHRYANVNDIENVDLESIECPVCHHKMIVTSWSEDGDMTISSYPIGGDSYKIGFSDSYCVHEKTMHSSRINHPTVLTCENCNAELHVDVKEISKTVETKTFDVDTHGDVRTSDWWLRNRNLEKVD